MMECFQVWLIFVEGRMIVTNTLIEKKEKKQSFWLLLKMSLIEFGIWDLKKHEKWGIIKQGIDLDGRDKWDGKCDEIDVKIRDVCDIDD